MIKPGSTIGLIGGGQLGRMFVQAAQRMGYRVHVFTPGTDTPAGQVANLEITAPYNDIDACRRFAAQVDVITLEDDCVSLNTIEAIGDLAPIHPGPCVLKASNNRVHQKMTLESLGLPIVEFGIVNDPADASVFVDSHKAISSVLKAAVPQCNAINQVRLNSVEDVDAAFESLGNRPAIVEEFVECDFELSVITARSASGEVRSFDPITTIYHNNLLDVAVSPSSRVSPRLRAELIDISESLVESLDLVGLMCVEFFYSHDGRVLVNEISACPHSSGLLTIEACVTSQFEQQVRAICGLPLGSTQLVRGAAMASLLGQNVPATESQFEELLQWPTAKLHLYGKVIPSHNRKMGHISMTADCADIAEARVREARSALLLTDAGRLAER